MVSDWELIKAKRVAHEKERQVLFGNEAFVLGALQAVSAGLAFGIVSQFDRLDANAGRLAVLLALTAVSLSLACSVIAGLFSHEYKKWSLKAGATNNEKKWRIRVGWEKFCLRAMRVLMWVAAVLVVAALPILMVAMWVRYL